jgi:hypothetical protein
VAVGHGPAASGGAGGSGMPDVLARPVAAGPACPVSRPG